MKKRIGLAIIIIMLFNLIGCSNKAEESEIIKAKVGSWKTAQTIQPFFYQDYMKGDQLIEVLPFSNPGDMKAALLAGSLDLSGSTLVTAISAASRGEPIVVVAGLCNKSSAFVVRSDSDIQRERDLLGKKIAYVPGTIHHLLLLDLLAENGLDPIRDVELIRIDFFDMGQALAQKTVDAFYSGEPYPSIALVEGYGRILSYPQSFGNLNSVMITTKDKIKEEPIKIQTLVSAHIDATEALTMDQDLWFKKAKEFGTAGDVMEISADNIELIWDIDTSYLDQARELAFAMKKQGLIQELPDMAKLFDLQFIKQDASDETDKN